MEKNKATVSFVSLGCFKNLVDTEVLGGMLVQRGLSIVSSYEQAEWVIVNSCGFIRDAKEESIEEILKSLERKTSGEIRHVVVFGCLTQRYYQELKQEFKGVDIIWGVNDLDCLADLIAGNGSGDYQDQKLFLYNHGHYRIKTTIPTTTFIKISEGCNMPCSFCAIPKIRGPYRSRPMDSILLEIEKYQEMGYKEINLISQNSTYYGKDINGHAGLPQLIKHISKMGLKWLRILYLMPEEVDPMLDELLEAFSHESVIPYFDLPFQHVSAKILKQMNRRGTMENKIDLIAKIRKAIPEAVIRSSFIIGFPGETQKDFQQLCEFSQTTEIERIGVFPFSPEEDTSAFSFGKVPSQSTVKKRKNTLMDISDENLLKYNQRIKGTIQSFLPMGPWSNQRTIGRIASQAPEIDGLTTVDGPFKADYQMYPVHISGFEHEIINAERK